MLLARDAWRKDRSCGQSACGECSRRIGTALFIHLDDVIGQLGRWWAGADQIDAFAVRFVLVSCIDDQMAEAHTAVIFECFDIDPS